MNLRKKIKYIVRDLPYNIPDRKSGHCTVSLQLLQASQKLAKLTLYKPFLSNSPKLNIYIDAAKRYNNYTSRELGVMQGKAINELVQHVADYNDMIENRGDWV